MVQLMRKSGKAL